MQALVAAADLDEFEALGVGFCLDQQGQRPPRLQVRQPGVWTAVRVVSNNSNACAQQCLHSPDCTGYVVLQSGFCAPITDPGFDPSAADGTANATCFWRHRFVRNSRAAYQDALPVPKVIWSFWSEQPKAQGFGMIVSLFTNLYNTLTGSSPPPQAPSSTPPPFLRLCEETWRRLNPDYQIRILNETSMWTWLKREDLPRKYDDLMIQHKADAIRQALLVNYGGVWIDASILLLKPLDQILGPDPMIRTFFHTDNREASRREQRVDPRFYVENWFLAAPARDPLLVQTQSCFNQFFAEEGSSRMFGSRDLSSSGQFSSRQLQEMAALGLNSYFAMYACLFKALDEDRALWHWWISSRVRHLDSWWSAFLLFKRGWDREEWLTPLVGQTDPGLVDTLTSNESLLIKFPATQRDAMIGLTPDQLWRTPNTLREVLKKSLENTVQVRD